MHAKTDGGIIYTYRTCTPYVLVYMHISYTYVFQYNRHNLQLSLKGNAVGKFPPPAPWLLLGGGGGGAPFSCSSCRISWACTTLIPVQP